MRISDWSSDVCSSDLPRCRGARAQRLRQEVYCRLQRARPDFSGERRIRRRTTRMGRGASLPILRMPGQFGRFRSEEHTSELQSLMRISYAVFCLKKKKQKEQNTGNKKETTSIKTTKSKNNEEEHKS